MTKNFPENFLMRRLETAEQPQILPLIGRCFPDYWEQIACNSGKMPFEEISFAAFDDDVPTGHCGVIPYEIWCNGKVYPMAGIASVATSPEYRKQGIAANLCRMVMAWARERKFHSLPLYTGFFRVYESVGWCRLDVPETLECRTDSDSLPWVPGWELNEAEKAEMIRIYEAGENFNGKVLRKECGTLHSWERIFNEPEFLFARIPGAYAVKSGGVVVEFGSASSLADSVRKEFFAALGENGLITFFLPPTAENQSLIRQRNLQKSSLDAMHGERPMVPEADVNWHYGEKIYFPVVDKF